MRNSILILLLLVFASCGKQKPQLPSNKQFANDSTTQLLQEINRRLIAEEDTYLQEYVTANYPKMQKTEVGIYYLPAGERNNEGSTINHDEINISYQLYDLNGTLLYSTANQKFKFGKQELPVGLEQALKTVQRGDSSEFIIPWYLAYGSDGNEHISGFTSIRVQMSVW